MNKHLVIIFTAFIIQSSYAQVSVSKSDTTNNIAIKGKVNSISFLVKDWKGKVKTFHIYWVEIKVNVDTSYLRNQLLLSGISSVDSLLGVIKFVSNNENGRDRLYNYNQYKEGDTVVIHVSKVELIRYIKKEADEVLIKEISLR
jgi:hypothetical protein